MSRSLSVRASFARAAKNVTLDVAGATSVLLIVAAMT
jgi:hypothetical protein